MPVLAAVPERGPFDTGSSANTLEDGNYSFHLDAQNSQSSGEECSEEWSGDGFSSVSMSKKNSLASIDELPHSVPGQRPSLIDRRHSEPRGENKGAQVRNSRRSSQASSSSGGKRGYSMASDYSADNLQCASSSASPPPTDAAGQQPMLPTGDEGDSKLRRLTMTSTRSSGSSMSPSASMDSISSCNSVSSHPALQGRRRSKELRPPAVETPSSKGSLKLRRGLSLTLELAETAAKDEAAASMQKLKPQSDQEEEMKTAEQEADAKSKSRAKSSESAAPAGERRTMLKDKFLSGGASCCSPENKQPAVQLMYCRPVGKKGEDQDRKRREEPLVPRRLPAAFANRRSVIFFDWDDTLCPTTWIRSIVKAHMAELQDWDHVPANFDWQWEIPAWFYRPLPEDPRVIELMADLQRAVINVLNCAQAYGAVCIVTNAVPGWVDKTMKKWLPELKQYIYGHGFRPPIQVLYAQEAFDRPTGPAANLPWLNDLGEYMWWKWSAMAGALEGDLCDLYRLGAGRGAGAGASGAGASGEGAEAAPISWCANSGAADRIRSVVSIGDNEAEMQACRLAVCALDQRRGDPRRRRVHPAAKGGLNGKRRLVRTPSLDAPELSEQRWPWVKCVKLRERMTARHLSLQLEDLAELLPKIAAARSNFRLELGQLESDLASPLSPLSPNIEKVPRLPRSPCALSGLLAGQQGDFEVEKLLLTQTV